MARIRTAAKALIVRDDYVLLNRCVSPQGETYYALPGGGQHTLETLEETLVREVREETGYRVQVGRLAAVAEEIEDNPALREAYPDFAHRVLCIFIAHVTGEEENAQREADWEQLDSVWVPAEQADTLPLRPAHLAGRVSELLEGGTARYAGCVRQYSPN